MTFFGYQLYENKSDTLEFSTRSTDTEDMIRKEFLKTLKQGLLTFLIDTELLRGNWPPILTIIILLG